MDEYGIKGDRIRGRRKSSKRQRKQSVNDRDRRETGRREEAG